MATFNIATFNCAGMADTVRRAALLNLFRKLPVQIICVQETHSRPENEAQWAREWAPGEVIFNSATDVTAAQNGVAIFINDSNLQISDVKKDLSGRVISMDVSTRLSTIHLTNIDAPASAIANKNNFFDSLYPHIISKFPNVLAGDFNTLDRPDIDRYPPGAPTEKNKTLISLCNKCQLTDAFRTLYGDVREYTRQGQSQARLDRIYTSKEILIANQYSTPESLSDHDIVILQIKNVITPERGKGIWTNNTTIYDQQPFQQDFTERWTKWQTLHPILFVHKSEWWMHIKSRIKDLNQKYARRQAHQRKNEEKDLEKDLREVWEKLPQKPELLPKFYSIKKQLLKNQLHITKEKVYEEQAIAKGNFALGSKKFFEQFAKKRTNTKIEVISNPQGKLQSETKDILKTIHEFYQQPYREKPNDPEAADHFLNHFNSAAK